MAKIIYQPKGKAKEYSPWAANFYNGCSNKCDYCYNRHCQAKELLGKDEPTLKKGLDMFNVIDTFKKELTKYREQILADGKGLFFNFVSDPMLEETRVVNITCILYTIQAGVPAVVLTKCADWYEEFVDMFRADENKNIPLAKKMIKFGFTLTWFDDMEHGVSTNNDRITLMKKLNYEGYKTWASIEPIIDCNKSLMMMCKSAPFCDEYKIGVLSGKKNYTPEQVKELIRKVNRLRDIYGFDLTLKDSVFDFIK